MSPHYTQPYLTLCRFGTSVYSWYPCHGNYLTLSDISTGSLPIFLGYVLESCLSKQPASLLNELMNCWIVVGMKGNLTERRLPCFLSVAMCAPSIIGALYFLLWQTYILRLEAILIIVHMVFVMLETILGIVTISAIQKSLTQLNQ